MDEHHGRARGLVRPQDLALFLLGDRSFFAEGPRRTHRCEPRDRSRGSIRPWRSSARRAGTEGVETLREWVLQLIGTHCRGPIAA